MALVKGHIDPDKPTLVRMHSMSLLEDIFAEASERAGMLESAMRTIGEEGAGVVVLISRPTPDYASRAIKRREAGLQVDDDDATPPEQRDYGVGAQILAELGVHDMILLTNTRHSLVGLEGYDLSIVGQRPIGPEAR
jgi:3,4-dihydroxy 2-butanone 4-phosphate synthase/GTP cyclohydrolase II